MREIIRSFCILQKLVIVKIYIIIKGTKELVLSSTWKYYTRDVLELREAM
jgi:hypothetical protein